MRCRHQTFSRFAYDRVQRTTIEAPICVRCGESLPIAPANDADENVRIELRAAELAVQPAGTYTTSDAQSGWFCAERDYDPPPWPHCPDAWAGWLAHAIASHPTGGDDGRA